MTGTASSGQDWHQFWLPAALVLIWSAMPLLTCKRQYRHLRVCGRFGFGVKYPNFFIVAWFFLAVAGTAPMVFAAMHAAHIPGNWSRYVPSVGIYICVTEMELHWMRAWSLTSEHRWIKYPLAVAHNLVTLVGLVLAVTPVPTLIGDVVLTLGIMGMLGWNVTEEMAPFWDEVMFRTQASRGRRPVYRIVKSQTWPAYRTSSRWTRKARHVFYMACWFACAMLCASQIAAYLEVVLYICLAMQLVVNGQKAIRKGLWTEPRGRVFGISGYDAKHDHYYVTSGRVEVAQPARLLRLSGLGRELLAEYWLPYKFYYMLPIPRIDGAIDDFGIDSSRGHEYKLSAFANGLWVVEAELSRFAAGRRMITAYKAWKEPTDIANAIESAVRARCIAAYTYGGIWADEPLVPADTVRSPLPSRVNFPPFPARAYVRL